MEKTFRKFALLLSMISALALVACGDHSASPAAASAAEPAATSDEVTPRDKSLDELLAMDFEEMTERPSIPGKASC
ncbi:MAG: hypothetical protein HZB87_07835 [Desulfatitalea sp.]|nr:hypothetical protein [Desulfatitalea sp.]